MRGEGLKGWVHDRLPGRGTRPGIGWVRRDAPYRDSAALDLLEPLRPELDGYLLRLIGERTFGAQGVRGASFGTGAARPRARQVARGCGVADC
jgi:hypothetical protein